MSDLLDGRRVLLADDDFAVRLLASRYLESLGLEVQKAEDGMSALEIIREAMPDAILLDVVMPGLDGFEVCQHVRSRPEGQDIPVIMMTGLDDAKSIQRALRAGASDFVTKPVQWALLGHRIEYLFRNAGAAAEMRKSREQLTRAQRVARLAYWSLVPDASDWTLSNEVIRLLGLPEGNEPTDLLEHIHPEDRLQVESARGALRESGEPYSVRCRLFDAAGQLRYIVESGQAAVGAHGERIIEGTVQDISERAAAEQRIDYLVHRDVLTGLPNRKLFRDRFEEAIAAAGTDEVVACLFIDLDRFKTVNDSLGHSVGDEVLRAASLRIVRALRAGESESRSATGIATPTVARFGGDEFVVLLPGLRDTEQASAVGQRLITVLAESFALPTGEAMLGGSIGCATYPSDGVTADQVLRYADAAMYVAKRMGGGRLQAYDRSISQAAEERLSMENELHHAIERQQFELLYQPQIELHSGALSGAEALIRWRHPKRGLVSPMEFIEVAEANGLILPIGEWVVREACSAWTRSIGTSVEAPTIAVNVSTRQLYDRRFVEHVVRVLRENRLPPARLHVEITESAIMENRRRAGAVLAELDELGVQLALDDFGTGFSSLAYLREFPFKIVKIDRAFIRDLEIDPRVADLVRGIIAMASALDLDVVAEGVENEAQLEFLRSAGCAHIQGYLISKPIELSELHRRFADGTTALSTAA